ncbi:MAG: thioredoxin family protein [Flavobacteriales bacterium]|nr:thioredoxin family protein [Flavobacteriales bacterium]
MKVVLSSIFIYLNILPLLTTTPPPPTTTTTILTINESEIPLKGVKLRNTNDQMLSLEDIKGDNGLIVIFSANSCPFVVGSKSAEGWEGRYSGIYEEASKKDVGMVLINSNHAMRASKDSFAEMQARAKTKNYQWPYLFDEGAKVADAFGARTTPHVFLFDKDGILVYRGAIDDNVKSPEKVKNHYLKNAVENLAKGLEISPNSSRNIGCSIKRH